MLYRRYIADSFFASSHEKRLIKRYSDLLENDDGEAEEIDGDEIASQFITKHSLKQRKGGSQK